MLPLALGELPGNHTADVDRAVEMDPGDVVGKALVDGDMAVLLRTDEMRLGEAEQAETDDGEQDEEGRDPVDLGAALPRGLMVDDRLGDVAVLRPLVRFRRDDGDAV